ncbi:MAG: hypothetical protein WCH62_08915, partial [Candidatus Omnitrophota bacterium]
TIVKKLIRRKWAKLDDNNRLELRVYLNETKADMSIIFGEEFIKIFPILLHPISYNCKADGVSSHKESSSVKIQV